MDASFADVPTGFNVLLALTLGVAFVLFPKKDIKLFCFIGSAVDFDLGAMVRMKSLKNDLRKLEYRGRVGPCLAQLNLPP